MNKDEQERLLINKQEQLIDKLLENNKINLKYTMIKECIIAGIVALAFCFCIGSYFFTDYDYGTNNVNSNNSNSQIEIGGDINE